MSQVPSDIGAAADAFLAAVAKGDLAAANDVLRSEPRIASTSVHVAAVLGRGADVGRLVAEDPSRVGARAGAFSAEPLLWLCHSPFHGESPERDEGLAEAARALLDAGADPDARDGVYGLPALYAVTGVHDAPRIARILLDVGAEPNDGESVFHAAERFHEESLELLLSYGVELNRTGDWGNTPLYFLLRYWDVAETPTAGQGMRWLLDHGADPDVRCGPEGETSLHVAARMGQSPGVVRLLLDHGADLHAAWRLRSCSRRWSRRTSPFCPTRPPWAGWTWWRRASPPASPSGPRTSREPRPSTTRPSAGCWRPAPAPRRTITGPPTRGSGRCCGSSKPERRDEDGEPAT